MTAKEKYEVHGDGPYFVFDKETQRMASTIGFTTQQEAEALIDLLSRGRRNQDD